MSESTDFRSVCDSPVFVLHMMQALSRDFVQEDARLSMRLTKTDNSLVWCTFLGAGETIYFNIFIVNFNFIFPLGLWFCAPAPTLPPPPPSAAASVILPSHNI